MENTKTMTAVVPSKLDLEKPAFSLLVRPVVSNLEILTAWQAYQELKQKLLTREDFATIQGQEFAKKSAYRKLALAFGVSVELVNEKRVELPSNSFGYEVTAKAISPNGRFMTSMASAHSNEKKFSKPSDVRAIAQTRATNRAISDLLGGVLGTSADEIVSDNEPMAYVSFPGNEITESEPEEDHDNGNEMNSAFFEKIFEKKESVQNNPERISDKQQNLIIKLVDQKFFDDEKTRSMYLCGLGEMTKRDASKKIAELLRA